MPESNQRVTIYDIAREVNVSATTVYRAISGKGRISSHTQKRILESAEKMGYKINMAASSMSRKTIRIGIVLDLYFPGFHNEIILGMRDSLNQLYDFNVEGVFAPLDQIYNKDAQINKIKSLAYEVDAIIFAPKNAEDVYIELIDECKTKGVPIFTCVNDIPDSQRAGTVYANTNIVGDMGAQLLTTIGGGARNAILVSNKDSQNQCDLIKGFHDRLALTGNMPLGIYETQNDERIGYYITDMLIKDHPDLSGIFVGISQSMGVCDCLIEKGLAGKVKLVCVDIFDRMAEMLENDVVQMTIYQQTKNIGEEVIMLAYEYLTNNEIEVVHSLSKPEIIIKSNYSEYL